MLWSPNELGLGRAYVAGELDAEGDIVAIVEALRDAVPEDRGVDGGRHVAARRSRAARRAGRARPAAAAAAGGGPRCAAGATRCAATPSAISHHYDVGNDFYRLVLGRR